MMIGNIIDDKEIQDTVGYEKYDIVVANILADATGTADAGYCKSDEKRWYLYYFRHY